MVSTLTNRLDLRDAALESSVFARVEKRVHGYKTLVYGSIVTSESRSGFESVVVLKSGHSGS